MDDESVQQRVSELLLKAWMLPPSVEQVSLVEEAVALADAHGDLSLGYEARTTLIEAATFAGYPEKALLAFSWCLGHCDRDPERFDEQRLLWQYKWVAADLPYFPQISRARIEEVHADMEQRYVRCGQSLQPIHKIRWLAAMRMGEPEEAERQFTAAQGAPRDEGSDCEACEQDDLVNYLIYRERYEEAVERAKPILDGSMSCASVPHVTLASLLRPLLRLGRLEDAVRYHRWGWRLIEGNRKFIDAHADHLEFLVLTGNLEAAGEIVEASAEAAAETTDLDDRFQFFCAAMLLARALDASQRTLSLELPGAIPGEGSGPDRLAWFEAQADALAETFDARNGNAAYRERFEESLSLLEGLARPYPLSEAASGGGD